MGERLIDSNPYLRKVAHRKRQVFQTVSTSSAIEGVRIGVEKAAKAGKTATKVTHLSFSSGAARSARSPKRRAS